MSRDFQFISVVDDLQVEAITEVEGSVPRTIRVLGRRGFRAAQRVQINGVSVDAFTIASDRVLLVVPGASLDSTPVIEMRAVVFSAEMTGTRKIRLIFGSTVRTKSVEGLQKLVQQVVKTILTNAATNRFDPAEGGDLLSGLGESMSPSARSRIASVVGRAVSLTAEHYLSRQAGQRLPADEKLLSLDLTGVSFDDTTLTVVAEMKLVTFAGDAIDLPLIL